MFDRTKKALDLVPEIVEVVPDIRRDINSAATEVREASEKMETAYFVLAVAVVVALGLATYAIVRSSK